MSDESFILVNLKDAESKKLAQVISNETSRKILDYLAQKTDATATDIAKAMNIPLSTAHYNLMHLLEAKLIVADEYHYSEKGKEVDHYKLSNKFVIIAPQTSTMESIRTKLGKILPVALICTVTAGIISLFNKTMSFGAAQLESAPRLTAIAEDAAVAGEKAFNAAPTAAPAVADYAQTVVNYPDIAFWFLVLYVLIDLLRKK
jgi:DNA-binding transcriptional ArsR family regulator